MHTKHAIACNALKLYSIMQFKWIQFNGYIHVLHWNTPTYNAIYFLQCAHTVLKGHCNMTAMLYIATLIGSESRGIFLLVGYVWTTALCVFLITIVKLLKVLMLNGLFGNNSLVWTECEHFLKKKKSIHVLKITFIAWEKKQHYFHDASTGFPSK